MLPFPRHLLLATAPPEASSVRRRLRIVQSPFSTTFSPESLRVCVSSPNNETLFEYGFYDVEEGSHDHWINFCSWLEVMRRQTPAVPSTLRPS